MENHGNKRVWDQSSDSNTQRVDSPESKIRRVDSSDSGINSSESQLESVLDSSEVQLQDDIFNMLDDTDNVPERDSVQGLDSVIKSFEDEINAPGSDSGSGDPAQEPDSGELQSNLGYLLEASDDELGLPPTVGDGEEMGRAAPEMAELARFVGFEDDIPSYDAFGFGSGFTAENDGGAGGFVTVDGLFDYSDPSADVLWRSESLQAMFWWRMMLGLRKMKMIAVIVVKFQIVTLKKTRIRQNCWTLRHLVKVVTPPLILINKVESTNSDFVDEVGYYDELDTPVGSEDEGPPKVKFPCFKVPENAKDVKFEVGLQFSSKKQILKAIKTFAIMSKKNLKVVTLKDDHCCFRIARNSQATPEWVAKRLSMDQAYRTKVKAMEKIEGKDGNNQMFPIAYAVVEYENYLSWKWFVDLLIADLDGIQEGCWVFIYDQQKGLVEVIKELGNNIEHRLRVKYLYGNWKKYLGAYIKKLKWMAARATTTPDWDKAMNQIKSYDVEAWKDLERLNSAA
ncbi:hypothetical protein D0Y65_024575 [Glycine soja]|nr:hypothetical protein D0Y65_024575 [Glycine soja]